MSDFSAGDVGFIVLILGVIHGIMLAIGYVRRRKTRQPPRPEASQDS